MGSANRTAPYNTAALMIFVLLIALAPGSTNGATVSLAVYAAEWPGVDYSTILLISTLPMLTMIPANLCFPLIVGKLGYRKTAVLGFAVILASGLLPMAVTSLPAVLVFRAIMGLGLGMVGPMYTSLVMEYFENKPGLKSKGVGWTQTMVTVSGILFSMVGGWLAGFGAQMSWLVILMMLPVFIVCFFLPEPKNVRRVSGIAEDDSARAAEATESDEAKPAAKEKISWKTWTLLIIYFILMMINISFLVNSSFIVDSMGFSTAEAGVMMSFSSAGGGIAAFIYGFIFRFTKDRTVSLGLIMASAFAILMVTVDKSLFALYAFTFLIAFGWNTFFCYIMYAVNVTAPASRIAFINGFLGFVAGAAYFLSGYWNTLIGTIFGQQTNYFFPLVVLAVVFGVVGIIWLIKPLVKTSSVGE